MLAKAAGVLGFFISVATFILTRWERRARLSFGLDQDSVVVEKEIESLDDDDELYEIVKLRVSNVGPLPLVLDFRTLEIAANEKTMSVWYEGGVERDSREVLLKPNETFFLQIHQESFIESLKLTSTDLPYNEYIEKMHELTIQIETTDGKKFVDKTIRYWEATSEFRRK